MRRFNMLLGVLLLLTAPVALSAVEVEVTIENLAPPQGNFLTPVWVGFHAGTFDLYDRGAPLRESVERVAEDGNFGPLLEEFDASPGTANDGVLLGPGGPIAPGETASAIFDLNPENAATRYFSYAAMVLPSNDAFIANGSPLAHRVFDLEGNLTPFSFVIRGGEVLDGGTEVNTELPADTAFFGQAAPDTGTVENGVVELHPGFNAPGTGGILDDPTYASAQFTAPGYPIARVTVRPVRVTESRFAGSGAQQVPPVATDATAACNLVLSRDQSELTVNCEHDVQNVTVAHVHAGARGENGPIVFPFADPASPISETFAITPDQVDALLAGGYYVNVHSEANPNGEVRAQIDSCFAGPNSICLNDGRFQVSAVWETADNTDNARGFELTPDSGVFYFFNEENIELDVKVLDGCADNGNFWVFSAGLTNQGVTLTVIDTETGLDAVYTNPIGRDYPPILDTSAFATCP
ncbi:MAG: spondin domain-containing protein [Acidobacteriota bacterium]